MAHEGKFAWTVTVGEKGQIVIPKQARELFNIKPGDNLLILGDINKGLAIPPKSSLDAITKMIFETCDEK
ncbi:MAG: AbrB/MazE/SpoVT family DNA-binding domain-containing protein [Spirochaetales bacterium]|nr:AbrB/MazE/SpoVT family DNA-binding domain-containing protein [Spirochaetales bacterium]